MYSREPTEAVVTFTASTGKGRPTKSSFFLVTTLLAAACSGASGGADGGGGGSSGSCSPISPHACSGECDSCGILTRAQVSAAVGASVAAGDNSGDPHSCDFIMSDSNGLPVIQVLVGSNVNAQTFDAICHAPSDPASGLKIVPVTGVGDDACYEVPTSMAGDLIDPIILNFEKGCWAYSVTVTGPSKEFSEATIEADEKKLALDAVPNL
jgi:hypothetical protein